MLNIQTIMTTTENQKLSVHFFCLIAVIFECLYKK